MSKWWEHYDKWNVPMIKGQVNYVLLLGSVQNRHLYTQKLGD